MKIRKAGYNMPSSQPTVLIALMGLDIGGAETHVVTLCKHLKDMNFRIIIAAGEGAYVKDILDYGIKYYNVSLSTKQPLDVIQSIGQLTRIVKNEKVDLIHAHARIPAFLCNIISKFYHIPLITTGHGHYRHKNSFYNYFSAWGQKTIVISEDVRDYFESVFKVKRENMVVIYNGIDTEVFKPEDDHTALAEEFQIEDSCQKVLLVSRIDDELADMIIDTIKIAPQLNLEDERRVIFIVGSGNRWEEVNKIAQQINREIGRKTVYVTGARTDINHFMNFCDVFIGISRAALEAMACEKPVILAGAWSFIGILHPELIEQLKADNFTGRSFTQPVSPELICQALKEVLDMSAPERSDIGKMGRQIVLKDYSSQTIALQTARVYNEILNKGEKK